MKTLMKRATVLTSGALGAAVLTAAAASAGTITPAPAEPVIYAPTPVATTGDWTGGYIGGELGYGDASIGGANGDGVVGGVIAGYDYDFGNWVVGAGIDYDFGDINMGGTSIDNIARLKLRAGYDTGPGLIYLTAGGAQAYTSNLGDDTGYFAGVGYEHMLNDKFSVGGEVLYHEFEDFNGSGTDLDGTTLQVRAAYRF
ncbi:MAG: outer membrane protein [Paracoccaceae bacterium]